MGPRSTSAGWLSLRFPDRRLCGLLVVGPPQFPSFPLSGRDLPSASCRHDGLRAGCRHLCMASFCPSCFLCSAHFPSGRCRNSTPRFSRVTSAVQLAQNRKCRIHTPELGYQLHSLCSQLGNDRCQTFEICHFFPSGKDVSRIVKNCTGTAVRLAQIALRFQFVLTWSTRRYE